MTQRCPGNGLIVAGLIVTLIGLAVVVTRAYHIPREWTTVGVGVALLAAGAARRMLRGPDAS
ncbi:MAG TPA: hypothetical protein VMQ51_01155 [Candidatus Binatia bacterium]|nr:hypothetical protein [Candidatus Binatia bacterium]